MCGSHGVEISGEMEIYPVHRHYLRISASCRTPLEAETRSERRFPQSHYGLLSYTVEPQGKPDRDRSLADTCLGGCNRCDKNKPVLSDLFIIRQRFRHFRHIMAILFDHIPRYPRLGRHLGDIFHPYASGNFDIRLHIPPVILQTAGGASRSWHLHPLLWLRNRTLS